MGYINGVVEAYMPEEPGKIKAPLTIVMMGEPVPFARTRINHAGGHFTPAKQRNAASVLKLLAQQEMNGSPLFDEPLRMDLRAELAIPASWRAKKRARAVIGDIRPGGRPDIDNLYKLAADALQSVVFRNDSLIVEASLRKVYSTQPKLVVTVQRIGEGLK